MNFKQALENKKNERIFKKLEKLSIKEIDKMIEVLQIYKEERLKKCN